MRPGPRGDASAMEAEAVLVPMVVVLCCAMLNYAVLCGCKISEVRSTVDGVKRRNAGDGMDRMGPKLSGVCSEWQ